MQKDLRGRDALRASPELAPLAASPAFDAVETTDLRRLAVLLATTPRARSTGSRSRPPPCSAARAFTATSARAGPSDAGRGDHPATRAVLAASRRRGHGQRRGTHHRDNRTPEAILHGAHWAPFRGLPGVGAMTPPEMRAVDRFLLFCAVQGRAGREVDDLLAFARADASSMLLRTVRKGLEAFLTSAHPAVVAAEAAHSRKEAGRYRRRRAGGEADAPTRASVRALAVSVPADALPEAWRQALDALRAGRRGRGAAPRSIDTMTTAARQLVWAARRAGLPDAISLDTVRAYDRALEERGARASSRAILFASLRALGRRIGVEEELLADLGDLVAHYERRARGEGKLKEGRLADLPDLGAVFDHANALLDEAAGVTDRRRRVTLYVDGAALAFLSLIPLRNQDTVLVWGRDVCWIGDDGPEEWGLSERDEPLHYYLDLRTSKIDAALAGPLAPILTPFLDALILRGQDERLLPELRRRIMEARSPVFPRTNGAPRSARGLSSRWRAHLGTGSIISRTRIHTMLGALGERGTRAALALCAQRSPRTAAWYQAEALGRRRMLEGQEMIAAMFELTEEDKALLAELGKAAHRTLSRGSGGIPELGRLDRKALP